MLIDMEYIESLKEKDVKTAKNLLAEYASENFEVFLKRTKALDNMIADLIEEVQKKSDEPVCTEIEDTGLTISDLIVAAEKADNTGTFIGESKPLADEVISEFVGVHKKNNQDIKLAYLSDEELALLNKKDEDEIVEDVVPTLFVKQEQDEKPLVENLDEMIELDENFSPTLNLLGSSNSSYCTLPWWIYDWIAKNPDWKANPNSFPHHYGINTLLSLIYYIKRDGQVRIRETRNSSFQILK